MDGEEMNVYNCYYVSDARYELVSQTFHYIQSNYRRVKSNISEV